MNRMNRRTGVYDCHVPGICLIIADSQTEEVFHQEDSRLCWVLVWCHSNRGTDLLIHCYSQQISRAIAIRIYYAWVQVSSILHKYRVFQFRVTVWIIHSVTSSEKYFIFCQNKYCAVLRSEELIQLTTDNKAGYWRLI